MLMQNLVNHWNKCTACTNNIPYLFNKKVKSFISMQWIFVIRMNLCWWHYNCLLQPRLLMILIFEILPAISDWIILSLMTRRKFQFCLCLPVVVMTPPWPMAPSRGAVRDSVSTCWKSSRGDSSSTTTCSRSQIAHAVSRIR